MATENADLKQVDNKEREIAVDYYYEIIDKMFSLAAGELTISISFATIRDNFTNLEMVCLLLLWTLLFLTVILSLISFRGRYRTQMVFSFKLWKAKPNTSFVSEYKQFYDYVNICIYIFFILANTLLFFTGTLIFTGKNITQIFQKVQNLF
jgi:hypothetical protein